MPRNGHLESKTTHCAPVLDAIRVSRCNVLAIWICFQNVQVKTFIQTRGASGRIDIEKIYKIMYVVRNFNENLVFSFCLAKISVKLNAQWNPELAEILVA